MSEFSKALDEAGQLFAARRRQGCAHRYELIGSSWARFTYQCRDCGYCTKYPEQVPA